MLGWALFLCSDFVGAFPPDGSVGVSRKDRGSWSLGGRILDYEVLQQDRR